MGVLIEASVASVWLKLVSSLKAKYENIPTHIDFGILLQIPFQKLWSCIPNFQLVDCRMIWKFSLLCWLFFAMLDVYIVISLPRLKEG